MAVKARERYRVDLIGLQAACEANYARLMRLLPDMRHAPEARRIGVTHGDQMLGVLALEVIVNCPYTTCLLYTSPSPRDQRGSRMPSSA